MNIQGVSKKELYDGIVQHLRTMDNLYAFKCKRFRNTRHTVTFGIPLYFALFF
jgi:hypothetical protein